MTKSFMVNLDRCIGCYACEIACKDENDLAPDIHRIRVKTIEIDEFNRFYVPTFEMSKRGVGECTLCPQLQSEGRKPACIKNCLTDALSFGESEEVEDKLGKMDMDKVIALNKRANVVYISKKSIKSWLKNRINIT